MLRGRFLWLVVLLIPIFGWGQSADRFQILLNSAPSQQPELASSKMDRFISDLQVKRAKLKSDETFLRFAFRESHKMFFHQYKAYSQFPEIFDSGKYDCLSATSFLCVVLDAFKFEYKIIETNYHIFLVVDGDQKQILLESTDKANGFVSDEQSIRERLSVYRENKIVMASTTNRHYYQYNLDLYQEVMPQQLPGLLYFNQAVTAFNNNDLTGCSQKLKKAVRIYNSPRIAEFAVILVSKVADSELSDEEKKNLIRPFASFVKAKSSVMATR
jgi:hypothetical protein